MSRIWSRHSPIKWFFISAVPVFIFFQNCSNSSFEVLKMEQSSEFSTNAMDTQGAANTNQGNDPSSLGGSAAALKFTNTPDAMTSSTTAAFAYYGVDNLGSIILNFDCGLDTDNLVPCDSKIMEFQDLSPGDHQFTLRAKSGNGNFVRLLTYQWKINFAGPAITNVLGPRNCLIGACSNLLTFAVSDSQSEIASIKCSVNNQGSQDCASPYIVSFPSDKTGTQSVKIFATNKAGISSTYEYKWTVNYPGAKILNFAAANPYLLKNEKTILSWETSNAVVVTLNGTQVALNGSMEIAPTITTNYILSIAGISGSPVVSSVTVTVSEHPTSIAVDSYSSELKGYPGAKLRLAAQVKSASGFVVPGVPVSWSTGAGGGSLYQCANNSVTNYRGIATCYVFASAAVGENTFTARVNGVETPATFKVQVQLPLSLEIRPTIGSQNYRGGAKYPHVYPGSKIRFDGWAYDASMNKIVGVPLTWTINGSEICPNYKTPSTTIVTSCLAFLNITGSNDIVISQKDLSYKTTLTVSTPNKLLAVADERVYYPNSTASIAISPQTANGDYIVGVPVAWDAISGGTLMKTCVLGSYFCDVRLGSALGTSEFKASTIGVESLSILKTVDLPKSIDINVPPSTIGTNYAWSPKITVFNASGKIVSGAPFTLTATGGAIVNCSSNLSDHGFCEIKFGATPSVSTITVSTEGGQISKSVTVTTVNR